MTTSQLARRDTISWAPIATIEKWSPQQVEDTRRHFGIIEPSTAELIELHKPIVVMARGNLLTTAGLQRLTNLLIAAGGQGADNTHTRIGVGNSTTAESVGQTDLQAASGSTNRWFQLMDATYPTAVNGVLTFKATFGTADGNFAWQEWGVDIGNTTSTNAVAATLLNRKVASLGTKASGAIWAFTVTITIS